MLEAMLAYLPKIIGGVGLFALAIATFLGIKGHGAASERAKQADRDAKARQTQRKIDDKVDAMDNDGVRRAAAKWLRNGR